MSSLEQFDTGTVVGRLAVLRAIENYVKAQIKTHRTELAGRMAPGSKVTAFNPGDDTLTLGSASMSNPEPVAYIDDLDAFEAWCRQEWPGCVEVWTEVNAEDPEVIEVLRKHAPHLVTVHSSVKPTFRERGLERATKKDVPGTHRGKSAPQLTVTPAENAADVVAEMVAASPVLRELEA